MRPPIHFLFRCFALLAAVCAGPTLAVAATLPVENCLDDGSPGSLRAVVATAEGGDVIDLSGLSCGTLTLSGGMIQIGSIEEFDPAGDPVNLIFRGPGADQLALEGSGDDRLLFALVMGTITFEDLTLRGGIAPQTDPIDSSFTGMGGCLIAVDSLELKNAVLENCTAMFGAGALSFLGNITLEDSEVRDNTSRVHPGTTGSQAAGAAAMTASGGASGKGDINVIRSRIHGNTSTAPAILGGGLFVNGNLTMLDADLYDNHAVATTAGAQGGGAVIVRNVSITRSRIHDNTVGGGAVGMGAAFYSANLATTLTDSVVYDNRAVGSNQAIGGGIYLQSQTSPALIVNSTVSGNRAEIGTGTAGQKRELSVAASLRELSGFGVDHGAVPNGFPIGAATGGGIAAQQALTLRNSTVAFNFSAGTGGGLMHTGSNPAINFDAPLVLESTIIARNEAQSDNDITGAITAGFAIDLSGSHNLVQIVRPDILLPPDTLRVDPQLDPLADHGGDTLTHALRFGSPAIDAGSNPTDLAFDQRGDGFPRTLGAATDMGAWEFDVDSIRYVVTPSVVGNGSITPDTPQEVVPGQTVAFTLAPAAGHQIWAIEGTCDGALSGDVYTTAPVEGDCTVVVRFVDSAQLPVATVTPASVDVSLETGTTAQQPLVIGNTGTGTLDWTLHEALAAGRGGTVAPRTARAPRDDVRIGIAAPQQSAFAPPPAAAAPSGSVDLSQTIELTPSASNSAACKEDNNLYTVENHYLRRFYFADHAGVGNAVRIESVDVGVESSTGQTIRVNLYALPSSTVAESIPLADLVPIGSGSTLVAAGTALTTVNVPVDAVIADTTTHDLVVEVVGDGTQDGTHFYMGSTPAPETHLSFFMAPECGIATPVTPASIGFPNMHLILVVHVDDEPPLLPGCQNPNDVPWLSVSPASGATNAGDTGSATVSVDAQALEVGDYSALLCLASNDMSGHALIEIPVHVSVTEHVDVPVIDVDPGSLSFEVMAGSGDQDFLTLGNLGTAPLTYAVHSAVPATSLSVLDAQPAETGIRAGWQRANVTYRTSAQPIAPSGADLSPSQTEDLAPVAQNSVACGEQGGGTALNRYFRRFRFGEYPDVAATIGVDSVDVGVESSNGMDVEVNLYTLPSAAPADTLPVRQLRLVGSGIANVPAGAALTSVRVPIQGAAIDTIGNDLVIEVATPDGTSDGRHFHIGSTSSPESHPGYLMASDCGIDEPTPVSAIGFPDMHPILVANVQNREGPSRCDDPATLPWLSFTPAAGTVAPGGTEDVLVSVDSTGLAAGEYLALVCVVSNDPARPLVELPLSLRVQPAGASDCIFGDGFEDGGNGLCAD